MTNHREKMKELLPIIQAYADGAEVEWFRSRDSSWVDLKNPYFDHLTEYRIKQTPDSIDWSHVSTEYKWMARDEGGGVFIYRETPEKGRVFWFDSYVNGDIDATVFSSYKRGTVDWRDSLVKRPESAQ